MIINGDCLEVLMKIKPGTVKCIFADVPDNIGLKYNKYSDSMRAEDYYRWMKVIMLEALSRSQLVWLSYNAIHDLEFSWMLRDIIKYRHPSWEVSKYVWYYTFNQYCDTDCGQGYRPMFRLKRMDAKIYPDEIRVDSYRMTIGDKRAAGPRVPSNVWSMPRVTGNSAERVPEIPTQHPIALMERIINFSIAGDEIFLDLFGGSGSSLRGSIGNKRVAVIELDQDYCRLMVKNTGHRFRLVSFSDDFDFIEEMKTRTVRD